MSNLTVPIKITRNTINVDAPVKFARNTINVDPTLTTAKSAYRLWLDAGNAGSLDDFFAFRTSTTTVNNVNVSVAIAANAAASRAALNLGNLATQSGNVADFLTTTTAEGIYRPLDKDAHTHEQLNANNSWLVSHNLNRYPSVTITDSAGSVVVGNVTYISPTQICLDFSAAFSGTAYLN